MCIRLRNTVDRPQPGYKALQIEIRIAKKKYRVSEQDKGEEMSQPVMFKTPQYGQWSYAWEETNALMYDKSL